MNTKNVYKYDINHRLISYYWSSGRMLFKYSYEGEVRKTLITRKENRTNFRTLMREKTIDGAWIKTSSLEIGDKYNTYCLYDDKQHVVYERRYNRGKKETVIKRFVEGKNGRVCFVETNGIKSVDFRINVDKLGL